MQKSRLKLMFFILAIAVIGMTAFVGCYNDPLKENRTLPYIISYTALEGGQLRRGEDPNTKELVVQHLAYGEDAETVTAIPNQGYYFVKWSDGQTDYMRQDKNVVSRGLQITAEFAEITDPIHIKYQIVGSGYIFGETEQTVQKGTDAQPVEACLYGNARQGDVFVGWSDGEMNAVRQDKNLVEDKEITAEFGYSIHYRAEGQGSIIGKLSQAVAYGRYSETVTALPQKGYRFVKWSDGIETAVRQDWAVEPIDVYAIFEWRDTDDFTYHYDYATNNYGEEHFTLTRGEVDGKTAVVPEREYFAFDGWYLDEQFTQKATDSNGNNLLGEAIFDSPSRDLYAKWNVKEEYVVTYKILMVYVTAVDGTFVGNDDQNVTVHYRMSDNFKRQCIEVTRQFQATLNDMLDGLVNFEVDCFFTTTSIDESSFDNQKGNISIYANQIPELNNSGVLENYRSVLTVYSLGGEENLFPCWSGVADEKYGAVPIDENIRWYGSLEEALEDFGSIMGSCVHEFIHTIEQGITCYALHSAYHVSIPENLTYKLYLLNQWACGIDSRANPDDLKSLWAKSEKGGIPYSVWANRIYTVCIEPECINGRPDGYGGVGTIDTGGSVLFYKPGDYDGWRYDFHIQKVPQGSRTTWLFAKADRGYKFLGWSDGEIEPLRKITDVEKNITLIAYFERLSYTVEYIAGEGGRIEGETVQTVLTGDRTTWVTAVPDEGYRFVGWSDNNQGYYGVGSKAERSDVIGENVHDENGDLTYDENGNVVKIFAFSVTAIFEKIEE